MTQYKRITIKVGSNVLSKDDGTLNIARIAHLVEQIATLRRSGVEVILVSSGAVAAGRSELQIDKKIDVISARQLYSAVGQVKLINRYADLFKEQKIHCAQVLTTKEDFSDRHHYLNMKNCISTLLRNNVLPIINENDAISVSELMFTDNDELSGLIASMQNSEALIILSNVAGIYNGNPSDPDATIIEEIFSGQKSWMKNLLPSKSSFGRGGILTKGSIARKLAKEGINVHIANGLEDDILIKILDANTFVRHTTFIGRERKLGSIKKWLAHSDDFAKGELIINDGAHRALLSDKATSLLHVGISSVRGSFQKGDVVKIVSEGGVLIGWGKTQYSSNEINTKEQISKAIVHYDYLCTKT